MAGESCGHKINMNMFSCWYGMRAMLGFAMGIRYERIATVKRHCRIYTLLPYVYSFVLFVSRHFSTFLLFYVSTFFTLDNQTSDCKKYDLISKLVFIEKSEIYSYFSLVMHQEEEKFYL